MYFSFEFSSPLSQRANDLCADSLSFRDFLFSCWGAFHESSQINSNYNNLLILVGRDHKMCFQIAMFSDDTETSMGLLELLFEEVLNTQYCTLKDPGHPVGAEFLRRRFFEEFGYLLLLPRVSVSKFWIQQIDMAKRMKFIFHKAKTHFDGSTRACESLRCPRSSFSVSRFR